jgi:hypothetical protein
MDRSQIINRLKLITENIGQLKHALGRAEIDDNLELIDHLQAEIRKLHEEAEELRKHFRESPQRTR